MKMVGNGVSEWAGGAQKSNTWAKGEGSQGSRGDRAGR